MFSPFYIRGLQRSSCVNSEEQPYHPSSAALFGISAADYDEIVSNHPQARLTYVDEDEEEQITVGSSFELSERLQEPIVYDYRRNPRLSRNNADLFWYHVFDVRRSKFVVELWKRFEVSPDNVTETSDSRDDASRMTRLTGDSAGTEVAEASERAISTASTSGEQPQSLLAAFEAELANVLSSSEASENRSEQPRPSYDSGSSVSPDVQNARPVVRDFIEKTLHHINCQASGISSGLAARMPGLRRQLSEAQRDLPENLKELLQGLFTCLEHSVATYGAVPYGRQLAEEAVQAGGPIAENAVERLQALASEFGNAGRTLFAAFENEFGRDGSNATSSPTRGPSSASGMANVANSNYTSPGSDVRVTGSSTANCSSLEGKFTRSSADPDSHPEVRTLFIGNVGYKVTAKMISDVFHSNGFILDVDLPLDTASNEHVGFGYLRFLSVSDANLAMQKMQGVHIDGHAINLEFSETDRLSPCMPPSCHQPAGSAAVDSLRGIRCECGVDHELGDQNLRGPSKHKEFRTLGERQPAVLEHGSSLTDDLPTDERATTPKPLNGAGGRWENLHPEREMSRFPPVSQLEAQHLAEQWRIRAPGPLPKPGTSEAPSNNNLSQGTSSTCQTSSAASAEAPSSQTERRSLNNIARNSTGVDTWARLDKRERGLPRPTPYRNVSEGFPDNPPQPQASLPNTNAERAEEAEIENCISSLVNMGFGSPEQGGRDRLGVYAAAAKGNVYDAVGMIEEEQKIYADLRLD